MALVITNSAPLDSIVHEYGAWNVLAAALRAILKPRMRFPGPDALSDRLRRDIGLGCLPPPRPPDPWIY